MTLTTCLNFISVFKTYTPLTYLSGLSIRPHGATHVVIAGHYGCNTLAGLVESGSLTESERFALCPQLGFMTKDLYRSGMITSWTNCTYHSYDDFECGFHCADQDDFDVIMLYELAHRTTTALNNSQSALDDWYHWYCGKGGLGHVFNYGDHLESSSDSDPSFWPIHPNLERLYHVALLANLTYVFNWTEASGGQTCYYESWDLFCNTMDDEPKITCCDGHNYDDGFLNFETGVRYGGHGWGMTNAEYMRMSDITSMNYSLPYVYDSLYWDHCTTGDINGYLDSVMEG